MHSCLTYSRKSFNKVNCLSLLLCSVVCVFVCGTMAEDPFDQFDEDETEALPLTGKRRLFSKELRCMMYGFGDDQNPYTESVDLLEDLVIEYITDMTHQAMEIGRTGRVQVEDIIFLVRKDPRKYARVRDLLTMNEELKKARKAFDEVKYAIS